MAAGLRQAPADDLAHGAHGEAVRASCIAYPAAYGTATRFTVGLVVAVP